VTLQYSLFFIQRFRGKVLFNVPMSDYTSLRVGGGADVMAFPQDEGDLRDLMAFAESKNFSLHVLGGGTNLLVRDGGIRGIVVNMTEGFKDAAWQEDGGAVIGAGLTLSEALKMCAARGASGLEFASGIPGTIGGAVVMNAGAYGGEMKGVVEGVEVVGRKGQKGFIPASEIGFSYRKTELPKGAVVVRAHMRFVPSTPEEVRLRIASYREKRRAAAAVTLPNAGSVFKNPEGDYAGRLIEEAGLKGERAGDAEVSTAHANYIVNRGRARAKDVLALMAIMRDRVFSLKGIVLEPEIKVVGEDR
jgi:UDP-N-acetylmuramate dehydrogenase